MHGQQETLPAREYLTFEVGAKGSTWLIEDGWLFGLRTEADGAMKSGALLGPGDLLGIAGLGLDQGRDLLTYTLTEVQVYKVPTYLLERFIAHDPELSRRLLLYMIGRYNELLAELHRSTLLPLADRIESFLAYMERRLAETGDDDIYLSQATLAMAVGAHPVSVSRAIHQAGRAESVLARLMNKGASGVHLE
ncbi:MAG: Crp/Fnr family transcriptional regulator [Mycobacterium leprae]